MDEIKPDVDSFATNFTLLANHDAEFAKYWNELHEKFDFHDPEAFRQLTKSLLSKLFQLKVDLPDDRLCPPVPIRYKYIQWVEKLVEGPNDAYDPTSSHTSRNILGIDIGVGASCIFGLLGCRSHSNWKFIGTEIDAKNLEYAQRNVTVNGLDERIELISRDGDEPLLDLPALKPDQPAWNVDFVMCNPPFFESKSQHLATLSKINPPFSVCTGADVELICEGGDVGFACKLLNEGFKVKGQVKWFTCMLGKKKSVEEFILELKNLKVDNWLVTPLIAGFKTRRWVIAWSFGNLRAPARLVYDRPCHLERKYRPASSVSIVRVNGRSSNDLMEALKIMLNRLPVYWKCCSDKMLLQVLAVSNVWSRLSRRNKCIREECSTSSKDMHSTLPCIEDVVMGTCIFIHTSGVELHWTHGHGHLLFESFSTWVKSNLRKI